ncbi:hypothetical protein QZH41_015906, partial [Actinostola sp. cb2023]
MVLANGSTAPFQGRGMCKVRVGNIEALHPIWVADIEPEGILGLDFLRTFGGELVCKNGSCELQFAPATESSEQGCRRVVVESTTVIPPGSELIVPGRFIDPRSSGSMGVLEPSVRFAKTQSLLLAKTLVNTEKEVVPLRVLNVTNTPCTLYKGTVAASCEDVIEVNSQFREMKEEPVRCVNREPTKCSTAVPKHLEDMFQKSGNELSSAQREKLSALLIEYADIFTCSPGDLGRTNLVEHRINTGDTIPIKQPARRLPMHRRAEAEEHVKKMLNDGIIEPSSSAWASPIVLVKKKDGSTRFCVDYRKLNEVTLRDSYPLPLADSCFDALTGSRWFSTLDLSSGYWQVALAPEDREKTAFATGSGGLYHFAVMPFGLVNAPATFERFIEKVLAGLPWEVCLAYLDDIIVHADTFEAEIVRLRDVMERLRNAGVKLNPKKCRLFQQSVYFLGHVVSADGISTDPEKNRADCALYYRRFIKGFADIARPLHRLTEKGREFVWTSECDVAFNQLKTTLSTAPVLAYPTSKDPFILDTDASNIGLGAVLSQVQDGEEKVIAYYSKSLSKAERNYCVTRKELLAIVNAVKRFHHYLYGRPFLVRTDHGALRWLMNFKNPEGQLARWLEFLGTYDLTIEHRSGVKHGNADALSRRPCEDCNHCQNLEQKERVHQDTAPKECGKAETTARGLRSAETREVTKTKIPDSWTSRWSNEDLRQEQLKDPDLSPLIHWKETTAERPAWAEVSAESCAVKAYWSQWARVQLHDGVLYRRWETDSGEDVQWQLVVPRTLRPEVLRAMHDAKTAGHLGVSKTLGRVRQRFYWHRCSQTVRDWCRRCDLCAARKKPQRTPRAAMRNYNVGAPMERVALDVLGPLPESDNSNKYVLVVADYFTKWTEAYAIPNQEAVTVATKVVDEFVARFGVPLQIHSDQGRNFESAVFKEMCTLLGIEKTRTTPLHPQSDGMVERYNRTLESMMAKFTAENQRDWDVHLPLLMMAYRTAVHETTGCTPSMLMLGREAAMPVDLLMGHPPDDSRGTANRSEYAGKLLKRMETVHRFARQHLKHETERQKRYYDHRGVRCNHFNRGDAVWLHNPKRKKGRCPKLQNDVYEGPFLVISQLDDVTYRIQKGAKTKPKVVHHNRLKPYEGTNAPTWLDALPTEETTGSPKSGE